MLLREENSNYRRGQVDWFCKCFHLGVFTESSPGSIVMSFHHLDLIAVVTSSRLLLYFFKLIIEFITTSSSWSPFKLSWRSYSIGTFILTSLWFMSVSSFHLYKMVIPFPILNRIILSPCSAWQFPPSSLRFGTSLSLLYWFTFLECGDSFTQAFIVVNNRSRTLKSFNIFFGWWGLGREWVDFKAELHTQELVAHGLYMVF